MSDYQIVIVLGTLATRVCTRNNAGITGWTERTPSGWEMLETIMAYLKTERKLLAGRLVANIAIREAFSAITDEMNERTIIVMGRNIITGLPDRMEIPIREIVNAVNDVLFHIIRVAVGLIQDTIKMQDPLIMDTRITLTGDFSSLMHLDKLLEKEIRESVHPQAAVIVASALP